MDLWNKLTAALSKNRGPQPSDLDALALSVPFRPAYENVCVCLSEKETRHGYRVLDSKLEIDLHSALRGDPIAGIRSYEARGRRTPYSALIELDNGNVLIVRHRLDDGDKISVVSGREAKGEILSTDGRSFKIKLNTRLGDSFGVDADAKIIGLVIVSLRLHKDDVARLPADSVADVVKALLLNPNQTINTEDLAKSQNADVLARTATGKAYRVRVGDNRKVVVDSAFAAGKGEPSEFLLRNTSFHAGQSLTLGASAGPSKTIETSRILEIATRRGDEMSENYARLEQLFKALASPTTQEDTKLL